MKLNASQVFGYCGNNLQRSAVLFCVVIAALRQPELPLITPEPALITVHRLKTSADKNKLFSLQV